MLVRDRRRTIRAFCFISDLKLLHIILSSKLHLFVFFCIPSKIVCVHSIRSTWKITRAWSAMMLQAAGSSR